MDVVDDGTSDNAVLVLIDYGKLCLLMLVLPCGSLCLLNGLNSLIYGGLGGKVSIDNGQGSALWQSESWHVGKCPLINKTERGATSPIRAVTSARWLC